MKLLTPLKIQEALFQFEQGKHALKLGAYPIAEEHFTKALKIMPNSIEIRAHLAYVFSITKQYSKAVNELKTLLKSNINLAQTHHNLANMLFQQQLYTEAVVHYQSSLKLDSKRIDTLIDFGACYYKMAMFDKALAILNQAYILNKNHPRILHLLGVIYAENQYYDMALSFLESAINSDPKQTVYRLSFANVLERASLEYEAELEYHHACESNPNYLDAFVQYGDFLLKNRYHNEALECFERAEQLAPKSLDILHNIAQCYLGMGNTMSAINVLSNALSDNPQSTSTLVILGQAYQEAGKLDDALAVSSKIISIDPNNHKSYTLQSRIKKSTPDDGLVESLLNKLNQSENLSDKTEICFSLGKIFNDHKNHHDAFKYYAQGNTEINAAISYSKDDDAERFNKLIEFYNTNLFNDLKDLGGESNLPVMIVGMPRSSTTLTEQIISSHPDVIGAGEVSFWGAASKSLPHRLGTDSKYPECVLEMKSSQSAEISEMYLSTLKKIAGLANNPRHITDKMPHNFLNIGLIALLFPNVKIIHTIRDPIDTCLSIFFQHFNAKGHPYSFDLSNLGYHYKQYQHIMKHWHEVLPGRIMDIHYEDTVADPEFWSRKLIDHVGLEWSDACLAPHKLERTVKTASHWQVRQPIYKTSVQRWKNYEEFIGPLIEALKD
jgi:tetratricopeptide (TPR) repeat protein